MPIFAVADTHTFHKDLVSIPEGEALIHAGDFCGSGSLEEIRLAGTMNADQL